MLQGTGDLRLEGDFNFSVAPDGSCLVFSSSKGSVFRPRLVIYDLKHPSVSDVVLTPLAENLCMNGQGPHLENHHWIYNPLRLAIEGEDVTYILDPSRPSPQLTVLQVPPERPREPKTPNPIEIRRLSQSQVSLIEIGKPGRELARHETGPGLRVYLKYPKLSPNRKHLVYLEEVYRGSLLKTPRAFLLSLDGGQGPQLLAKAVYGPVHWHPSGRYVLACIKNGTHINIYQFEIPK